MDYSNPIMKDPTRLAARIAILEATPKSTERDALIKTYRDALARLT